MLYDLRMISTDKHNIVLAEIYVYTNRVIGILRFPLNSNNFDLYKK